MSELITIKGTAQESGKQIKGYLFPKTIKEFNIPAKVLFAPNYSPIFYKEEIGTNNGKPISIMKQVQSNKKYNSVNIVSKNEERNWLITDEGNILKFMPESNQMLLSDKPSNVSNTIITPEKKSDISEKLPLNFRDLNLLDKSKFPKLPVSIKLTEDVEARTYNKNGDSVPVILKKDSIFKFHQTQESGSLKSLYNEDLKIWLPYEKVAGKAEILSKNSVSKSTSSPNSSNDLNISIPENIDDKIRKTQIGFTLAGWTIFGILAYKYWNKSNFWKIAISAFGVANLYNTYKVFKEPTVSKDVSNQEKKSDVLEKINLLLSDLEKNPVYDYSELPARLNKFGVSYDEFAEYIQPINTNQTNS